MDMNMGGMDGMPMGDMEMGDGVRTPYQLQSIYWSSIGAAIVVALMVHATQYISYWQRLQAASRGTRHPAKPKGILPSIMATTTAVFREISYSSLDLYVPWRSRIQLPTFGSFLLGASYLGLVLALSFCDMDITDRWQRENLGYRTGYLTAAQLPLVYALAGKNNFVGLLVDNSYERLNWVHRWTARVLLITVTTHLIFWCRTWAQYDYILTQFAQDKITQRGFAAWCSLLWVVLSSFRPLRQMNYEFFVVQHLLTMTAFSAAVYLHLPDDMRSVFWIAIAFPVLDRVIRIVRAAWNNIHLRKGHKPLFGHRAAFERLTGGVTRITISNPGIRWRPGQHIFLSCSSIAFLQSHPFTISSLPQDSRLVLIAKAHKGGTRKIYNRAEEKLPLLEVQGENNFTAPVFFDGPYGSIRPLVQFDSVVLLAGSTGSTFTVPLLRSILMARVRCTRHVKFVWAVKSRDQASWWTRELNETLEAAAAMRAGENEFELIINVYVTCDSGITGAQTEIFTVGTSQDANVRLEKQAEGAAVHEQQVSSSRQKACGPDGTCCCTNVIEEDIEPASTGCTCDCSVDGAGSSSTKSNNVPSNSTESMVQAHAAAVGSTSQLHQNIPVLSGRPHVRSLIQTTLEQACGESAVVVCGPRGLVQDTRHAVVALSDERAVHKGTGAQGIYLHTESFSF